MVVEWYIISYCGNYLDFSSTMNHHHLVQWCQGAVAATVMMPMLLVRIVSDTMKPAMSEQYHHKHKHKRTMSGVMSG